MKLSPEKRKAFLGELAAVCKKYDLSLAHEDFQGAFLIDEYNQKNINWLMGAMVILTPEEEAEEYG
ncbi:MAG: hypothetical protein H6Q72_3685 [Firmicutes bacterium]|nr:hypothetical protein [Bacillota bacterium]